MAPNPDADDEVSIDTQVTEGREAVENALEILHDEDPESREGRAANELDIAATLLGAAGIRTDPRLAALRELFPEERDQHTVEPRDGVIGDYAVTFHDGKIIHESKKRALRTLGFTESSTHVRAKERDSGGVTAEMTLYVSDDR